MRQTQRSGDNSINYQAEVIHTGISYRDARGIAKDAAMEVFRENFTKLSREALAIAVARADRFTENFLSELNERCPEGFGNLGDPGVQSAIFDAQSAYAKTGDEKLGDTLVGILIDRTVSDVRDLTQLSLETAIGVAKSLSSPQIALLSCNFTVKHVAFPDVQTVEDAADNLRRALEPFREDLSRVGIVDPDYLVGVGCLILGVGSIAPERYLGMNYPGLFSEGFSPQQIPDGQKLVDSPLVMPCSGELNRYKLRAASVRDLDRLIEADHLESLREIAYAALTVNVKSDRAILMEVLRVCPSLAPFFELWKKLGMNSYLNTPTAVAIAHANTRRIAGPAFSSPLSQWIPQGGISGYRAQ
ncbi:LPO_1073/Vpar_1526 family protein [Streptomyces sp. NPDC051987]|uniref:LPO_1073/Vpar_1526 family protein n=1 Tax=Streptomyces sp. NPDC051987 TaxID=3155808 RepID=UPI00342FDFDE